MSLWGESSSDMGIVVFEIRITYCEMSMAFLIVIIHQYKMKSFDKLQLQFPDLSSIIIIEHGWIKSYNSVKCFESFFNCDSEERIQYHAMYKFWSQKNAKA